MKTLVAALATLLLVPFAQAETVTTVETSAPPRTYPSVVRIIPTYGTASFNNGNATLKNLGDTQAGGLFVDIGSGWLTGETGILAMSGDVNTSKTGASVNVNSWSIPALAKFNFSGNPHSTVFAKLGAMTYDTNRSNMDIMGVAGLGGAIPLGRNSAINLDASYNQLFNNSGDLTNYKGIALLGGLSFGF